MGYIPANYDQAMGALEQTRGAMEVLEKSIEEVDAMYTAKITLLEQALGAAFVRLESLAEATLDNNPMASALATLGANHANLALNPEKKL